MIFLTHRKYTAVAGWYIQYSDYVVFTLIPSSLCYIDSWKLLDCRGIWDSISSFLPPCCILQDHTTMTHVSPLSSTILVRFGSHSVVRLRLTCCYLGYNQLLLTWFSKGPKHVALGAKETPTGAPALRLVMRLRHIVAALPPTYLPLFASVIPPNCPTHVSCHIFLQLHYE